MVIPDLINLVIALDPSLRAPGSAGNGVLWAFIQYPVNRASDVGLVVTKLHQQARVNLVVLENVLAAMNISAA